MVTRRPSSSTAANTWRDCFIECLTSSFCTEAVFYPKGAPSTVNGAIANDPDFREDCWSFVTTPTSRSAAMYPGMEFSTADPRSDAEKNAKAVCPIDPQDSCWLLEGSTLTGDDAANLLSKPYVPLSMNIYLREVEVLFTAAGDPVGTTVEEQFGTAAAAVTLRLGGGTVSYPAAILQERVISFDSNSNSYLLTELDLVPVRGSGTPSRHRVTLKMVEDEAAELVRLMGVARNGVAQARANKVKREASIRRLSDSVRATTSKKLKNTKRIYKAKAPVAPRPLKVCAAEQEPVQENELPSKGFTMRELSLRGVKVELFTCDGACELGCMLEDWDEVSCADLVALGPRYLKEIAIDTSGMLGRAHFDECPVEPQSVAVFPNEEIGSCTLYDADSRRNYYSSDGSSGESSE